MLEQYIIDRIQTSATLSCVLDWSTPVVSFGDFTRCNLATLGINPSKNEFIVKKGPNRFVDLRELGVATCANLDNSQAEQVYRSCSDYFKVNPYRSWFDNLEFYILKLLGASYYDGTACHLDLSQWATYPIWRGLKQSEKDLLLSADIPFLLKQLELSEINTLLVNGLTAYQTLFNFIRQPSVTYDSVVCEGKKSIMVTTTITLGQKKVKVFAFNKNLQSTVGLTNHMRLEMGKWIASNY